VKQLDVSHWNPGYETQLEKPPRCNTIGNNEPRHNPTRNNIASFTNENYGQNLTEKTLYVKIKNKHLRI